MSRGLLLGLALAWSACERPGSTGVPSGLRVPLPDGWRATATPGGLAVGPGGRAVLLLETSPRDFPAAGALESAVAREKVTITSKEHSDSLSVIVYSFEGGQGFLGARRLGARTIWCASAPGLKPQDLEGAVGLCRALSWEGDEGT